MNINIINDKSPQLGGNLDWKPGCGYMKKDMVIRVKKIKTKTRYNKFVKGLDLWDYTCLDDLTSEEIISLLKSNRISWERRKLIRISLSSKIIQEFIPVIATIAVASVVTDVIQETMKRNEK